MRLPSDQDASGRSFGDEEIELLREVLASGTLTSTKGRMVPALEAAAAELLGSRHAVACASGTAAVHTAVAAVDPEPGDEIVTTAITDMGALSPILYQGAIPVFADVDPVSGNVTPDTVAAALSERTKAVVVTHLFGVPVDTAAVAERCGDVPVIEDAAQAWLARSHGRTTGTIGALGCFSLQQGKHVTTGEGGLVVTDDDGLARRMRLFVNKAWPYGEANPDHEFLAPNHRLSELAGAVGLAQLGKLEAGVATRVAMAERLRAALEGLAGIGLPPEAPGAEPSWWRYPIHVDRRLVPGGAPALGAALADLGVPSAPRYIQKPAFQCRVFTERRTFGQSQWPFPLARPEALDWSPDRYPGTFAYLDSVLVLPWNERYTEDHVDHLAAAIGAAVRSLREAA